MIACDIDGVLAQWPTGALPYIEKLGVTPNFRTYDLGLNLNQFKWVVDQMIENGDYFHLPTYPDVDVVRKWKDVVFLTRRRPGHNNHLTQVLQGQTKLWLKQHGLVGDVVFTQDKAAWCRNFRPDFCVDDYYHDVTKIHQQVTCYMPTRPWNEGIDWHFRINSLEEIDDQNW